ncbi:hypothetical protein SARC_10798, partial [Sphaeroforma arctica JP610]
EETVEADVGSTVLEAAHDNDIELEGACEGTIACSTCHVIVPKETFDQLPEMEEEEEDMLDLAIGLEDTYVLNVCRKVGSFGMISDLRCIDKYLKQMYCEVCE